MATSPILEAEFEAKADDVIEFFAADIPCPPTQPPIVRFFVEKLMYYKKPGSDIRYLIGPAPRTEEERRAWWGEAQRMEDEGHVFSLVYLLENLYAPS